MDKQLCTMILYIRAACYQIRKENAVAEQHCSIICIQLHIVYCLNTEEQRQDETVDQKSSQSQWASVKHIGTPSVRYFNLGQSARPGLPFTKSDH